MPDERRPAAPSSAGPPKPPPPRDPKRTANTVREGSGVRTTVST